MIRRSTYSFIIACSLILLGCGRSFNNEDYIRWVKDYHNGLHVNKQIGEFEFDVQYQPADYVRLQKMTTASFSDQSNGEGTGEIQYYILTIGLVDKSIDFINYDVRDMEEKQHKLYYFSYRFQDDITLLEENEVLPCVLFHFEKPVDLRGSRTFLLGFERHNKDAKEATLKITSDQFGSLPVSIKVSKVNIPDLKL